jgi:hypothetical protein
MIWQGNTRLYWISFPTLLCFSNYHSSSRYLDMHYIPWSFIHLYDWFFLLIVSSWHFFVQVLFGQCRGEDFGKAEGSCSNKLHWLFGSHQCYTGSMLSHNYTILWCTQPKGEDIEVGDLEDRVSELEQTLYSIQKQHFRWPYVVDWVAEVIFCNRLSPWSWFGHGGAEFVRPEGTGDTTATNWCFWGLWVYSTPGSAGWEIQTLWVLHRSCGSLANIYACSQFVTFLLGNNSLELIWRIHE